MMTTGEKIKEERRKRGLSQRELAERAEMSAQQLGQYENDRYLPKLTTLKRIANAINPGLSMFALMGDDEYLEIYPEEIRTKEHKPDIFDDLSVGSEMLATSLNISENMLVDVSGYMAKMNKEGQQKVVDYACDLSGNPWYSKDRQ